MVMIMPKVAQAIALEDLATNLLTDGTLQLFKNDVQVTNSSQLSDFVEADFASYSEVPSLVPNQVFHDENGGVSVGIDSVQFDWSTAGEDVGNTIYGFIILDANGALMAGERLTTPKVMATANDSLIVQPIISLPASV